MRVATTEQGQTDLVEGVLEIGPSAIGKVRIILDSGKTLIRHIDDVLPLDDEAEDRMKNGYKKAIR